MRMIQGIVWGYIKKVVQVVSTGDSLHENAFLADLKFSILNYADFFSFTHVTAK